MANDLTLHFGVLDLPYSYKQETVRIGKNGKPTKRKGSRQVTRNETTGDIAEILEAKYGLMETFADMHMADVIEPALMDAIEGGFENLLMGAPLDASVFGSAEGKITEAFQLALDKREFDGVIPGVETEAAERGVNHRLAHPYAKRASRPSFIDTGLYQTNFKAWVDNGEG